MEEKRYSGLTNEQVQSRIRRSAKQNRVTITAAVVERDCLFKCLHLFQPSLWYFLAIFIDNMLFVPIVVVNSLIGIVQLRSCRILNKMSPSSGESRGFVKI